MRATLFLTLAAAAVFASAGCGMFTGYDAADPVRLTVETPAGLNTYGEENEAHPLYLYFFKVEDKIAFDGADARKLKAGETFSGVEAANPEKKAVHPAKTAQIEIDPMRQDRFQYLGVVAAFRNGNVKGLAKIPWTTKLSLKLGPQGILSFED